MKDDCEICQCLKCGEPYSRGKGSGVRVCYLCWSKPHPRRVKDEADHYEIGGPGVK
jgi:hypothetical protein